MQIGNANDRSYWLVLRQSSCGLSKMLLLDITWRYRPDRLVKWKWRGSILTSRRRKQVPLFPHVHRPHEVLSLHSLFRLFMKIVVAVENVYGNTLFVKLWLNLYVTTQWYFETLVFHKRVRHVGRWHACDLLRRNIWIRLLPVTKLSSLGKYLGERFGVLHVATSRYAHLIALKPCSL